MSAFHLPPRQNQRGVAVIEFALLLGFLLLLTVGITEIGRAFWYYSAIQKAAREGARCLSVIAWGGTSAEITAEQTAVNACLAIVRQDANSAGVYPALTASGIEMTRIATGGGAASTMTTSDWGGGTKPEYVGIQVNHDMTWLWRIGEALPGPGQSVTSRVQATMPFMH